MCADPSFKRRRTGDVPGWIICRLPRHRKPEQAGGRCIQHAGKYNPAMLYLAAQNLTKTYEKQAIDLAKAREEEVMES